MLWFYVAFLCSFVGILHVVFVFFFRSSSLVNRSVWIVRSCCVFVGLFYCVVAGCRDQGQRPCCAGCCVRIWAVADDISEIVAATGIFAVSALTLVLRFWILCFFFLRFLHEDRVCVCAHCSAGNFSLTPRSTTEPLHQLHAFLQKKIKN